MLSQTCINVYSCAVGNQTVAGPKIAYKNMYVSSTEILQNIFFCVQHKN